MALRIPVVLAVALFAVLLALYFTPRQSIPEHLLHHPLVYSKDFIPKKMGDDLLGLIKEMKTFPSNAADLQFYKTQHEHIGEAVPIGPNKTCEHPFLIPSQDKTQCVLPGRVDVARHYIMTGGPDGIKEPYEKLVSRVQSFGRYLFNYTEYPLVKNLFDNPSFMTVAKSVCPPERQYLDPFQCNFIMQVPSQTVAMHIDAPYFWTGTRLQFPQWLLVAKVFAGDLFMSKFINQVQVVGYLHRWAPDPLPAPVPAFDWADPSTYLPVAKSLVSRLVTPSTTRTKQGEFVYWDDKNPVPKREQPTPLAGSAVDGSKLVHAAVTYRPFDPLPFLDKSKTIALIYEGGEKWRLDASGEKLAEYTTDDLRISIVYRARCFLNADEANRFKNTHHTGATPTGPAAGAKGEEIKEVSGCVGPKGEPCGEWSGLTLEEVLTRFVDDLVAKGVYSREQGNDLLWGTGGSKAKPATDLPAARLELALAIMDNYIKYPMASQAEAVIPFNYCAIGAKFPALKPLVNLVC